MATLQQVIEAIKRVDVSDPEAAIRQMTQIHADMVDDAIQKVIDKGNSKFAQLDQALHDGDVKKAKRIQDSL